MTLQELQDQLEDLSAEILQSSATLQQETAQLHYRVLRWIQILGEIRDAIGHVDEPA